MPGKSTLYTYLTRSHDHLREVLGRLLDAMRIDAPDVRDLWSELDHGLHSHMEAEERFVLPVFARVDSAEALALLREHGELREYLLELGVAVDLHYASFARTRELVDKLARHAAREQNLLYLWADQNLDHRYLERVEAHARAPRRHAAAG